MKRIGIVVSKNSEGGVGVPSAYTQYFSQYGTVVPINALDEHIYSEIDLLVLPGGPDVNPTRYNQKLNYFTQRPDIQMEYFDVNILPIYIANRTPIFGICRGFQTLNVHFGGQLCQHMYQEYSTKTRGELVHPVQYIGNTIDEFKSMFPSFSRHGNNEKITNSKTTYAYKTNSLHHQGFYFDDAGDNIIPVLMHYTEQNIEAFVVRDFPIAGVQWHPEEANDIFSWKIIKHLLNEA